MSEQDNPEAVEPRIAEAAVVSVSPGIASQGKVLCDIIEAAMSKAITDWTAEGHAVDEDPAALRERMMRARVAARDDFNAGLSH